MSPLLGQIIRLLKTINLRPTESSRRPAAQFIAGKRAAFGPLNGFSLSWWFGDDTFLARDSVAAMIVQGSCDFIDCDLETAAEVVMQTLREVCFEKSIFDVDAVAFAQRQTLFDCASVSVTQCATSIKGEIEANLRARIGRLCTIHVVPRIKPTSFHLSDTGIHVIAKQDRSAWQRVVDEGFLFDGWSPENPTAGLSMDTLYSPREPFDAILVANGHGTQNGTRFGSLIKFRMLLAVMLAVASARAQRPYFKSGANPSEFCLQFPHASHPKPIVTRNDCMPLLPYYVSDIPIDAREVAAIRDWYSLYAQCSPPLRSRIEKAAHFLNLGMNSSDTESYINYFVTLDALLGERRAVETSILTGLSTLDLDAKLIEKARWLFDLRNEIVHGGSRYIGEWPDYSRYTRHFRTQPYDDIQIIAQFSVLHAPNRMR